MAKLIYMTIASLDGYIADEDGRFDWAVPDEEVHAFVNDLERPIGTHLYGRRLYEVMIGWETMHTLPDQTPVTLDFAATWQAAEKVVYSRTLREPGSTRTRIDPEFDPAAVAQLKSEADADLSIGGAELAASAFEAGLVDEVHLFLHPIVIGAGKPALPAGLSLELLGEGRFSSGAVHLHYRAGSSSSPGSRATR